MQFLFYLFDLIRNRCIRKRNKKSRKNLRDCLLSFLLQSFYHNEIVLYIAEKLSVQGKQPVPLYEGDLDAAIKKELPLYLEQIVYLVHKVVSLCTKFLSPKE